METILNKIITLITALIISEHGFKAYPFLRASTIILFGVGVV